MILGVAVTVGLIRLFQSGVFSHDRLPQWKRGVGYGIAEAVRQR